MTLYYTDTEPIILSTIMALLINLEKMTEDFDKKKQLKAMVIENKTPNTTG